MKKYFFVCILSSLFTSCSNDNINQEITLSNIEIKTQGNISRKDEYARYLCDRFVLTKEQVKNYFIYSRVSDEQEIHDDYNLLSCYSTGSIKINGEEFLWKIRAGGVADVYNEKMRILRVCDDNCCNKTMGIC